MRTEISNVEFYEHDSSNNNRRRNRGDKEFIGYASVTINDDLVINGFRVFETDRGGWVGNPGSFTDKRKTNWKDTVYGLSEEMRELIQEEILNEAGLDYVPLDEREEKSSRSKRNSYAKNSKYRDHDERDEEEEPKRKRFSSRKKSRRRNYDYDS